MEKNLVEMRELVLYVSNVAKRVLVIRRSKLNIYNMIKKIGYTRPSKEKSGIPFFVLLRKSFS